MTFVAAEEDQGNAIATLHACGGGPLDVSFGNIPQKLRTNRKRASDYVKPRQAHNVKTDGIGNKERPFPSFLVQRAA
jgi:hypothetical protein